MEFHLSTPFQNRLVGTIIVAAAVIIFLPDVLDGKKQSNQTDFEAIPQAPEFTGKMIKKPFPENKLVVKEVIAQVDEQAVDEQLTSTNSTTTMVSETVSDNNQLTSEPKITPAEKTKAIVEENRSATSAVSVANTSAINKPELGDGPEKAVNKEAWVIQLGSFKHQKNVEELVAKLKANGYTAFTKPVKTKQGNLTKVCVGPELIKGALEKQIPALKKLTNVQGKIARFYPTK